MFTGIITDIGEVIGVRGEGARRIKIACRYDHRGLEIGAALACDGVSLTIVGTGELQREDGRRSWVEVDISAQTAGRTRLSQWGIGTLVNLERALRLGDEMGGHIVSGHVDGLAEITAFAPQGDCLRIGLRAPEAWARFIAPQGSIALNGVSLTVTEVEGCDFGITIIPHTRRVTTWNEAALGDLVNLEVDTLARYVARLRDYG